MADALRERPAAIKAIPVRHVGRWLAAVVVLAIAAEIVTTLATALRGADMIVVHDSGLMVRVVTPTIPEPPEEEEEQEEAADTE